MNRLITLSLFVCILFFTNCKKEKETPDINFEIESCRWLKDSPCFLNLSFDDSQYIHYEIANLLDEFGFKGTFFLHASGLRYENALNEDLIDKYKEIVRSGHEIGNHGASHIALTKLGEDEILHEINACTKLLDSCFNIKCTCLAHPYNQTNAEVNSIVFNQNLFTRNNSMYYSATRPRFDITSDAEIRDITDFIDKQVANNSNCLIAGHGIENSGYSPCTKEFLIELLTYIIKAQNTKNIWVTTMSNGDLYESLFYEVKLRNLVDKSNQQISVLFEFPKKPIYNKFSKLLYSFKIHKNSSWYLQNNCIDYVETDSTYIFTVDLKQKKLLMLQYKITGE